MWSLNIDDLSIDIPQYFYSTDHLDQHESEFKRIWDLINYSKSLATLRGIKTSLEQKSEEVSLFKSITLYHQKTDGEMKVKFDLVDKGDLDSMGLWEISDHIHQNINIQFPYEDKHYPYYGDIALDGEVELILTLDNIDSHIERVLNLSKKDSIDFESLEKNHRIDHTSLQLQLYTLFSDINKSKFMIGLYDHVDELSEGQHIKISEQKSLSEIFNPPLIISITSNDHDEITNEVIRNFDDLDAPNIWNLISKSQGREVIIDKRNIDDIAESYIGREWLDRKSSYNILKLANLSI